MQKSVLLEAKNLSFFYGSNMALKNISISLYKNRIAVLIGPSGCGKTALLRCFDRMHDLYPGGSYDGEIIFCKKTYFPKKRIEYSPGTNFLTHSGDTDSESLTRTVDAHISTLRKNREIRQTL